MIVQKSNKNQTSFKHFAKSSTVITLRFLQQENINLLVKLVWTSINITLLSITTLLLIRIWDKLTLHPTVTTLETTSSSIDEIPFPAISICNINKISKRKAASVAAYISTKTGHNITTINEYMNTLRSFYDWNSKYTHKQMEFQKLLETHFKNKNFRPVNLLKRLAPSCEEFLVRCSWKNKEVKCSDIFQTRLTFEGYCCVFNYVKTTREVINKTFLHRNILRGDAGLLNGLTVEVYNNFEDYYVTNFQSLGATIHVFNPNDYPDKNSGSLSEQLMSFSTEFLLQVRATTFHTVKELIQYPTLIRQCYFKFEGSTTFGSYSESDCIVDCRIKSMKALCGCVPFMIPQNITLVCGLSDMECLNKYKIKWRSLTPPLDTTDDNLNRERHFALRCDSRCYPTCDSYNYHLYPQTIPIRNLNFGNNSFLYVYYNDHFSSMLFQDLYYYWFEVISKIGSTFSIVLGISLVSVIEILLYSSRKIAKCCHTEILCNDNFCLMCVWDV